MHIWKGRQACITIMIDRSGSMRRSVGDISMAQMAARLANGAIKNMLDRSIRSLGRIDHLFDVVLVGYPHDERQGEEATFSLLSGNVAGDVFCKISDVLDYRLPSAVSGEFAWCGPACRGETPMCRGFAEIGTHLAKWVDKNPSGPPPVVVNITDGFATDIPYEAADIRGWHERLTMISTREGVTKVFDIVVDESKVIPTIRPGSPSALCLPGWTLPAIGSLFPAAKQSLWSSTSVHETGVDNEALTLRGRNFDGLAAESGVTSSG